jgi:hypothetical protein
MKLVQVLLSGIPVVLAGLCVATTATEAIVIGFLWADGKFTQEKAVRYAAVIYGLDSTELLAQEPNDGEPKQEKLLTREEILDSRIRQSQLLQDRRSALDTGSDDIQILFDTLRSNNDRYEQMKSRFYAHLAELETAARAAAIEELQRTLEVLRPKQSKELLLRMLDDQGLDPNDDVLQDVVTIVKSMPMDKRKKILGEFKTAQDRVRLHEILTQIGELE